MNSQVFFARLAATAAKTLLFIYAIILAAQSLPLKLFDMAWQISVVDVINNNSILPLLSLVLAHLAAYLDQSEPRFEVFCQNLRRWALPVTLGFLLIIPLQSYNLFRGVRNYRQNAVTYERTITQNFANIRNAVRSASTAADLQKRLADLNVPGLSPADTIAPLPILRQTLLAEIEKAETKAKTNIPELNPQQIWLFGKQVVQSILTAFAFALAFAAAAKRSSWRESLLDHFGNYLGFLRKFSFVNSGKIFKSYNANRKAKLQLSQTNERQRRHSLQMNRMRQQQENEAKTRLKNLDRLKSKDDSSDRKKD